MDVRTGALYTKETLPSGSESDTGLVPGVLDAILGSDYAIEGETEGSGGGLTDFLAGGSD